MSFVNSFTIAVNIEAGPQNGSPRKALPSRSMKQAIIVWVLGACSAITVSAQTWTTQIGFEGGFARVKAAGAGSGVYRDHVDLPGSGAAFPALFLVIPVASRVALEPNLSATHDRITESSGLIPTATTAEVRLSLRADVAIASGFYVAGGGGIRYLAMDNNHSVQTGILGAIGYRHNVGSNLGARIEARWLTLRRADSVLPSNQYSLLLGIARSLRGIETRNAGRGPWRLRLGIAGGYVRTHLYGSVSGLSVDFHETALDFPGSGPTSPAKLFVIAPLAGRFALETGFGVQRTQEQGITLSDVHFAPRLDVAIAGGVYAAAGGNIRYLEQTGTAGFALAGANAAVGYRFPLLQELEGRAELGYTVFKQRRNFPFAENDLALLFGVSMPLK